MSIVPPKVSVLTTVYNGMEYLPVAVRSVLRQSFADFQYVIVDDGSSDGTTEYLRTLSDPRVLSVVMPRSGRGKALNAGLEKCEGELIAILDADDVASPLRLQLQYRLMVEHQELSVLGSTYCLSLQGLCTQLPVQVNLSQLGPRMFIRRNHLAHSSTIIRRAALAQVGGYDEDRQALFDYDLWLRLLECKHHMAVAEAPLLFKRIHARQNFEMQRRVSYLALAFRERQRAVRMFAKTGPDHFLPYLAFVYGLLPVSLRKYFMAFRACED